MKMLLVAVNKNNAEEYTSFQNAWHLQREAGAPISEPQSPAAWRAAKRDNEATRPGGEGKAWGNLPNWREMDSVKFRTTQKAFCTILQWRFVKEKQILQDILFNILLVNVLLYWIMGIKGMKNPYRIFQKQYF